MTNMSGGKPGKPSLFSGRSPTSSAQAVQPTPIQYANPKQGFFQRLQGLASLLNILIFAYIFVGEIFLPEPLKATTFLGKRLGGIQGQSALYAAPEQAEAAVLVDSAKANVELRKTCEQTIRDRSVQIYTACMNQPTGSHPYCNLEAELYRERYHCPDMAGEVQLRGQPTPDFSE